MLKIRVIPTLLWKDVGLVKGVAFDSWRRVGTVLPAIKVYDTREVDELILLDITATSEEHEPDWESLSDYADDCFVPLTFGGGIRQLSDVRNALQAGADKVAVNSAAYRDLSLIEQAAANFGSQCVVGSIDYRWSEEKKAVCFSHAGTQKTDFEVMDWVHRLEDSGAGEILLTSIDRDGTMKGYDLEMIQKVSEEVSIPVIASGGAGSYEDLIEAVAHGASAVAAASIFHFTEMTPLEAKKKMRERSLAVRPPFLAEGTEVVR